MGLEQIFFEEVAKEILGKARERARIYGKEYIGDDHLLSALISDDQLPSARLLKDADAQVVTLREVVTYFLADTGRSESQIDQEGLTKRTRSIYEQANELFNADQEPRLDLSIIFLYAILTEGEGVAAGILEGRGVTIGRLKMHDEQFRNDSLSVYMQVYADPEITRVTDALTNALYSLTEEGKKRLMQGVYREIDNTKTNPPKN